MHNHIAKLGVRLYTKRNPNNVDLLIAAFLDAPQRTLLKDDIRQDVLFDEYANDGSIRTLICEARKTLAKQKPQWEIITIARRGYKLQRIRGKLDNALGE